MFPVGIPKSAGLNVGGGPFCCGEFCWNPAGPNPAGPAEPNPAGLAEPNPAGPANPVGALFPNCWTTGVFAGRLKLKFIGTPGGKLDKFTALAPPAPPAPPAPLG